MNHCFICKKQLSENEGFGSGVDKNCKTPSSKEDEVVVCSIRCQREFEKTFSHSGRGIDHLSRVTGYVQRVSNWNDGKKQEFFDRKRYNL